MSEEHNIDDFCSEMAELIINNIDVGSIKPFLIMLEKELKEQLIREGLIEKPVEIYGKVVKEKIKVKDLGEGFFEIESCEEGSTDSEYIDSD